jgi:hypothetical protein
MLHYGLFPHYNPEVESSEDTDDRWFKNEFAYQEFPNREQE